MRTMICLLALALAVSACSAAATPDVQPTIQAAVQATLAAQPAAPTPDLEAAIQAAVEAALETAALETAALETAAQPTPSAPALPSPAPELDAPFGLSLRTYSGAGFTLQLPEGAEVESLAVAAPRTSEVIVRGPEIWVRAGDAGWTVQGPAYELTLRTYANPDDLDAESWARAHLQAAWQRARDLDEPTGALPVHEDGSPMEDALASAVVGGQPAFLVSYLAFDSYIRAFYIAGPEGIVEISVRDSPVENHPLARMQLDLYAAILGSFRLAP